jgi:hypothetical protein
MKFPLLVCIAFTLTACATQPAMIWVNAHPAKHDFKQDRFACLETSAKATPPATATGRDMFGDPYQYDVNAGTRDQLFAACMNAKDWTLQPAPKTPVQPAQTP